MLRRLAVIASLAVTTLLGVAAKGQDLGTTYTDLWWNPAESGWGVTVDHQQEVMFLTFFIYRSDNAPYWVTANLTYAGVPAGSIAAFSGNVYETSGPWFGGGFDPNAVSYRTVGTATFTASSIDAVSLTYTVDGVSVAKQLQRQTLRYIDFTGSYLTSWTADYACPYAQRVAGVGGLTVSQSGSTIQVVWRNGPACTFSGQYSQVGQYGRADGNVVCTDGPVLTGSMSFSNFQWTTTGMTAAATVTGLNPASCVVKDGLIK